MNAEEVVRSVAAAMEVTIDGERPWDILVRDRRFFRRVVAEGSLGLGESFVEGWWDCEDLGELHYRIALHNAEARIKKSWNLIYQGLKARLLNLQSRRRSSIVANLHYDVTMDHYRSMTDPWITLSCGYWKEARNLTEAQEAKLGLICRKIRLSGEDRVLDIGCGFGSFARYAAEKYGCRVVGVNISGEQVRAARELAGDLPVKFIECDYRDTDAFLKGEKFDKVVSAGMFEHVGYKNHHAFMEAAHHCLKDHGLFLLHRVGSNVSRHQHYPWFVKYIFHNGLLPSIAQIGRAFEGLFVMEDWHNFGPDYHKTLYAWYENFDRAWAKPKDDEIYRMWKYYLLSSAGGFKARTRQLWHLVLSKGGMMDGYTSVR